MSFFSIIEEARFDPKRIHAIVNKEVKERERRIEKLERMSGEQYSRQVAQSGYIFAVGGSVGKHYAISNLKRRVQELKQIPKRVDYYLELSKKAKTSPFWEGVLETTIRQSFKGQLRRGRKTISQLIAKHEPVRAKPRITATVLSSTGVGKPIVMKSISKGKETLVGTFSVKGEIPTGKPKKKRKRAKPKPRKKKAIKGVTLPNHIWKVSKKKRRR